MRLPGSLVASATANGPRSKRRSSAQLPPDGQRAGSMGRMDPARAQDPFLDLYARRTAGMSAGEVRALFAVASRPEVISLAGGMPFVQALPMEEIADIMTTVIRERGALALQYGGGIG